MARRFLSLLVLIVLLAGGWWLARQRVSVPNSGELERVARDVGTRLRKQTRELAAPTPPPAPQLSRYEIMLCNMANAERKKRGLSQLEIVPALADVARGHSREMMQKNYFAHESPTAARRTPRERYVLKFKRRPRLIAENIYKLQGPPFYNLDEADFRRAHEGWMQSPGHRANILRDSPAGGPTQIGVGIVVKGSSYWATQLFARP